MKTYKTSSKLYELKAVPGNDSGFPKAKISSSADAAQYARQFYFEDIEIFESFFIILLNNANNTIAYAKISQGGLTSTIVDVRMVAKYAVDSLATSVILVHNHPTGVLIPSDADIAITRKVSQGLALLDVRVLDHIIISNTGFHSMADNGQI